MLCVYECVSDSGDERSESEVNYGSGEVFPQDLSLCGRGLCLGRRLQEPGRAGAGAGRSRHGAGEGKSAAWGAQQRAAVGAGGGGGGAGGSAGAR